MTSTVLQGSPRCPMNFTDHTESNLCGKPSNRIATRKKTASCAGGVPRGRLSPNPIACRAAPSARQRPELPFSSNQPQKTENYKATVHSNTSATKETDLQTRAARAGCREAGSPKNSPACRAALLPRQRKELPFRNNGRQSRQRPKSSRSQQPGNKKNQHPSPPAPESPKE